MDVPDRSAQLSGFRSTGNMARAVRASPRRCLCILIRVPDRGARGTEAKSGAEHDVAGEAGQLDAATASVRPASFRGDGFARQRRETEIPSAAKTQALMIIDDEKMRHNRLPGTAPT